MTMPAIIGPMKRAPLKTIELMATAEGRFARSTRSGMSASRAGWLIAFATPIIAARVNNPMMSIALQ